VKAVALDSVPPTRRRAYEHLHALRRDGKEVASTTSMAEVLALPSVTTPPRAGGSHRLWLDRAPSSRPGQGGLVGG
jgi:hypothetical protein